MKPAHATANQQRPAWALSVSLALLAGLLMAAVMLRSSWPLNVPGLSAAPIQTDQSQPRDGLPGSPDGAPAQPAPQSSAGMTLEQVRARLLIRGSLAGTEPAGDWCVSAGKLTPCAALRSRFEYYLLGLGEVSITAIRALVADEARAACGETLAASIMTLWDRYWQLRNFTGRHQLDQNDRSTWMPAFEEQHQVRRRLLGPEWAKAFFEEDEQHFLALSAQLESGGAAPVDPGDPVPSLTPGGDAAAVQAERASRFGQAAADRLTKVDEEWADWEARLRKAREEWDRLKASPNLSDTLRQQSMHTYIQAHFKRAEYVRVEALLKL